MPPYTGARVGQAIGQEGTRFADLFMQMYGMGEARKDRALERSLMDERRERERLQTEVGLIEGGWTPRGPAGPPPPDATTADRRFGPGFNTAVRGALEGPSVEFGGERWARTPEMPEPEQPQYRYVQTPEGYAAIAQGGTEAVPVTLPGGGRLRGPSTEQPGLTPVQQRQQLIQRATGRAGAIALDLVGGPNPTMPNPVRATKSIARQLQEEFPELHPGEAQSIALGAVDNRRGTESQLTGRSLLNEQRAGGGDGFEQALVRVLGGDTTTAPATPAGGGPRNPIGAGRAYGAPAPADTGAQYVPEPPLHPDMRMQIDTDLRRGKPQSRIIFEMEQAGLDSATIESARRYIDQKNTSGL